jgi:hypothetical protein
VKKKCRIVAHFEIDQEKLPKLVKIEESRDHNNDPLMSVLK